MDFDKILMDVGEYGSYQKRLMWIIVLPCVLPCGFHAYNQLFMAATPVFWCKEDKNSNYTFKTNTCIDINNETCESWDYDFSRYSSTIVTEWNLVCSKQFYPTLALSLFGLSGLFGMLLFGYLQDGFGRRPSFFIYLFIECIFGVTTAFANDFWTWLIFRIGVGFTIPAILATPNVLPMEFVGPTYRTTCILLTNIAHSISMVLLSLLLYFFRDWRHLALSTSLPFILFFLYWWEFPESPRWLLARGNFDEAKTILQKISKTNKKNISSSYFENLKVEFIDIQKIQKNKSNETYNMMHLFKNPNLRFKTFSVTFIWFVNTTVYVGLSYYTPSLSSDEHLNFFLVSIVELPTYILLWPAMNKYGRKSLLCTSMLIGGIACLSTNYPQLDDMWVLLMFCTAKMGISTSYVVLSLFAPELYPTVVRGLGISVSSVAGMIGPVVIPLINYIGLGSQLTLTVLGVLQIFGVFITLILPETKNCNLPQTLDDAEVYK
ncbi:beta-alanine transporter [Daktulosphaira vitifoliae]|uniref:beta-alanine transporter n=1 Tax=Daktulosphaira vitifoliae TaxID=58002 RepID=UPI0021A9E833|nr:beta-alanine transporter [Daktulosphaira vitifoliae]